MYKIIAILLTLIVHSLAYGASSYYVDNAVGGTNSGTQANPWTSLASINWTTISAASKPCTIYVSGGASSQTYAEHLSWGANGTGVGSEVILKRPTSSEWAGHSGTVYMRPVTSGDWTEITDRNYLIIDGFDISVSVGTGGSAAVFLRDGTHHAIIRNCVIGSSHRGSGVSMYNSTYNTIQHNILGPTDPIYGDDPCGGNGDNNTIEYNIITGSFPEIPDPQHFDCYQIGNGSTSLNLVFRYNIIRETNSAGLALYSHDMSVGENVSVYIYGNLFEFTNAGESGTGNCPGISFGGTTAWVKAYIYNNTFVNWSYQASPGTGLQVGGSNSSNVWDIRNNVFYNSKMTVNETIGTKTVDYNVYYMTYDGYMTEWNDTSYLQSQFVAYKAASGQDANSLSANPLLTSVSATLSPNHDLRPTASSPGNNVGTVLGAPYDYGLTMADVKASWPLSVAIAARGAAYDIGPYEYESGVTTRKINGITGAKINGISSIKINAN